MVFSSKIFLFAFLPCVLLIYYAVKRWRRLSNAFLTLASLGFYAWGEPTFVFVMMFSIVVNWLFGLLVDKRKHNPRAKKLTLALMAVFNLGLLGVFKYLVFFMESANWAFGLGLPVPDIALPIGISFFTFQAMSYVIDVSRGKGQVQKCLLNVAFYIAFFPQLIAGPIVRYQTVAAEIDGRNENIADFASGARRFMIGLCKKMLLANNIGLMVDTAWKLNYGEMSTVSAWIAAFGYMIQVYYDFSGYSDMAIGMGRMFGFHFLENFDFPFVSKSVTGFWRRWHISLGSWFRDYLFIPLGGSRVKVWRLIFNMFLVWSLTGLWHGAAWTYFLWGCGFFALLAFERFTGLGKWMEKHWVGHIYTIPMIVINSVMIRCTEMEQARVMYSAMFGFGGAGFCDGIARVFIKEYGWFLLAAIVCGLPLMPFFKKLRVPEGVIRVGGAAILVFFAFISITYIATEGYNPFIYFNF